MTTLAAKTWAAKSWAAKASAALGEAAWLDAERARAYARILFYLSLVGALIWIGLARGGIDPAGKPLGTDFVSFWTASELALHGHAADVYAVAAHWGAQKALFGANVGYSAFFYPPPYLLICLPLAALPYFWSLGLWLAATGYPYWRVVRAYAGPHVETVAILAFPAVLINIGHGQNGFLSAALIGGGALLFDRRPVLAGLCLGALVYKPHLAPMIPIALIAARRWTTLAATAATAAGLAAASWACFGEATWRGFLAATPLARAVLERHLVGDEKMQSVFSAVRLLHGDLTLAYGLQGVVAIGAAAALAALNRRRGEAEGPMMAAAALIASPFLLDYDFTLLAIPLAWLFREGVRSGFAPGEKVVLMLAYMLPLYSRAIAGALGVPLAPLVVAATFLYVARRAAAVAPARAAQAKLLVAGENLLAGKES